MFEKQVHTVPLLPRKAEKRSKTPAFLCLLLVALTSLYFAHEKYYEAAEEAPVGDPSVSALVNKFECSAFQAPPVPFYGLKKRNVQLHCVSKFDLTNCCTHLCDAGNEETNGATDACFVGDPWTQRCCKTDPKGQDYCSVNNMLTRSLHVQHERLPFGSYNDYDTGSPEEQEVRVKYGIRVGPSNACSKQGGKSLVWNEGWFHTFIVKMDGIGGAACQTDEVHPSGCLKISRQAKANCTDEKKRTLEIRNGRFSIGSTKNLKDARGWADHTRIEWVSEEKMAALRETATPAKKQLLQCEEAKPNIQYAEEDSYINSCWAGNCRHRSQTVCNQLTGHITLNMAHVECPKGKKKLQFAGKYQALINARRGGQNPGATSGPSATLNDHPVFKTLETSTNFGAIDPLIAKQLTAEYPTLDESGWMVYRISSFGFTAGAHAYVIVAHKEATLSRELTIKFRDPEVPPFKTTSMHELLTKGGESNQMWEAFMLAYSDRYLFSQYEIDDWPLPESAFLVDGFMTNTMPGMTFSGAAGQLCQLSNSKCFMAWCNKAWFGRKVDMCCYLQKSLRKPFNLCSCGSKKEKTEECEANDVCGSASLGVKSAVSSEAKAIYEKVFKAGPLKEFLPYKDELMAKYPDPKALIVPSVTDADLKPIISDDVKRSLFLNPDEKVQRSIRVFTLS